MKKHYDIVIIGAGMVGLVCAHLLAASGLKILLCEAEGGYVTFDPSHYDRRVSALNKHSKELFQRIDCWDAIVARRVGCYDTMHIWESGSDAQLNFFAADSAQDYLGYIVENSLLRQVLLDKLPTTIDLECPIKFSTIEQDAEELITLTTQENHTFSARLVIGADGAHSWLRTAVGITNKTYSYEQQAMVATVKTEKPHQLTAYQCFLCTGPLAFLPLSDPHYSSIVWSADNGVAQRLSQLTATEFSAELTDVAQQYLGEITLQSELVAFPLYMRHAETYVKPGIALVGDAIRTIHPLAGQGVNLGFHDAQVLADIIHAAQLSHKNYASLATLKKYQRARKSESIGMIVAMEFFKQAFANQDLATSRLSIINYFDRQPWLKEFFVKIAGGV